MFKVCNQGRYVLVLATFILVPCAFAELTPDETKLLKNTFKCVIKDDKCIVRNSPGGYVAEFINTSKALYINKIQLVIDGDCLSSCGIGADRLLYAAREDQRRFIRNIGDVVCVTPRARFGFHEAFVKIDEKKKITPKNVTFAQFVGKSVLLFVNGDLQTWIKKLGPLPQSLMIKDFKMMNAMQAMAFWPECRTFAKQPHVSTRVASLPPTASVPSPTQPSSHRGGEEIAIPMAVSPPAVLPPTTQKTATSGSTKPGHADLGFLDAPVAVRSSEPVEFPH